MLKTHALDRRRSIALCRGKFDIHLLVADSETLARGKHPRSTPALLFSPSMTLVSQVEAKGGLDTDSVLKRTCHMSFRWTIVLAPARRFATDNVSDGSDAAAHLVNLRACSSSRLSVDKENVPARANKRAAPAPPPKPVPPEWLPVRGCEQVSRIALLERPLSSCVQRLIG
jgi:hypothetical protein